MKKQETVLKTIRLICAGSSEIAAKIREETNSRSVIENIMRVNASGIRSFSKYYGFSEFFSCFVHTALAGGSWCGTERQRGGGSGSVLM